MNGPQHYREAEQLLADAKQSPTAIGMELVAIAQVHATLALAAATALSDTDPNGNGMPVRDFDDWMEAASVAPIKATRAPEQLS